MPISCFHCRKAVAPLQRHQAVAHRGLQVLVSTAERRWPHCSESTLKSCGACAQFPLPKGGGPIAAEASRPPTCGPTRVSTAERRWPHCSDLMPWERDAAPAVSTAERRWPHCSYTGQTIAMPLTTSFHCRKAVAPLQPDGRRGCPIRRFDVSTAERRWPHCSRIAMRCASDRSIVSTAERRWPHCS